MNHGALERTGARAPSARTGAAQLARALAELGATHAFGLLGSAIAPVYDALHEVGLRVVHARHEAGAVFMAIEGQRATGRPAVVFTTTGPGLTNTLTGLAAAADEGARLVVVAAATERSRLGHGAFQETGPEALALLDALPSSPTRRLGRYVDDAAALGEALDAVEHGLRRPEGFVALLLVTPAAQQGPGPAERPRRSLGPLPRELPDPALVERAAARLASGPFVVWAGRGAQGAADAVRALVERTGARVMCTPRGKGIVDERHPAYLGVTGLGGHERVARTLAAARPAHVLVLGSRLGEMSSFFDAGLVPTEAFVHVDLDERAFGAAYPAARTLGVRADVGDFLRALLPLLPAPGASARPEERAPAVPPLPPLDEPQVGGGAGVPTPADVFAALQQVVVDPTDLPVMAEAGNAFAWAPHVLRLARPGRLLLSTRFGSMGHFATGVVGAALCTGRPALAVVGDGALAMNDEISTAVEHSARAIWVVLNDARYGMVEHGMRAVGLAPRGLAFPEIDFAAVAAARGAAGLRVRDVDGLVPALRVALASPRPVVVDVRVDPTMPPPFGRRNDLLRRG
jgi:acetolactate synthase-1/2/3 large subunit